MIGNLSVWGDGVFVFIFFGFRFLFLFYLFSIKLVLLKFEEYAIKFEVNVGDGGWGEWRVMGEVCLK